MTTPDYVTSLRAVFSRATIRQVYEGRLWYPTARGVLFDLSKRYRFSLKRAAFAAAALSNNIEWDANVALLEHVMWAVRNGVPARGHFPMCLNKAGAILARGDFAALSGPKVEPFARALLGDANAAVIDRWMWRAADGIDGLRVTEKRARDVALALRQVARDVHRPTADVQAIVWLVAKEGL